MTRETTVAHRRSVSMVSIWEGSRLPLGWLWTMIICAALDRMLALKSSLGSAIVWLSAVAASLGYTVKKIGRYHTLKEMDSIRIYNRTNCSVPGQAVRISFSSLPFSQHIRWRFFSPSPRSSGILKSQAARKQPP